MIEVGANLAKLANTSDRITLSPKRPKRHEDMREDLTDMGFETSTNVGADSAQANINAAMVSQSDVNSA